MVFNTADEMLEKVVNDDTDIYNTETGHYVFAYNTEGSICVYTLSSEEAEELKENSEEYWGASLGPGGNIYDAPDNPHYSEGKMSNMDYCKENYNVGEWIFCD